MNDEAMVASIRLFADGETARTSASVRLPRFPSLSRTDRTRGLSRGSVELSITCDGRQLDDSSAFLAR